MAVDLNITAMLCVSVRLIGLLELWMNVWIDKGGEVGGGGPWVLWHDSFPHTITNRLGSHTLFVERLWKMKAPSHIFLCLQLYSIFWFKIIDKERRFVFEVIWPGTQQGWTFLHFAPRDTKSWMSICTTNGGPPYYNMCNRALLFFRFSILPMDGGAEIWLILRCWGKSSMVCQQKSDAL